ncbi:hypothetical protein L596_017048 [Steinernema carpocapsae]|uniref:Uncharacterized protein n=1 Tax=Steinernema carpocapsae TaxID=34508 RepID=A0A4U5N0B1_STECR|nr:hypothetical protein L596_017048 [Steinernema carpocapsae]
MSKPKPKMLQEASPSLLSQLFEKRLPEAHTQPLPGGFAAKSSMPKMLLPHSPPQRDHPSRRTREELLPKELTAER